MTPIIDANWTLVRAESDAEGGWDAAFATPKSVSIAQVSVNESAVHDVAASSALNYLLTDEGAKQ